jgi:glycosyltransferase involved in cell wall biosynthesis
MDDAWEHTDRKGILIKRIKKLIHRNVDAAFVPAHSHLPYYIDLGFPEARIIYGVDVVDNDYFMSTAEKICPRREEIRAEHALPLNYFLFVGRFLPRKGIEGLITAYRNYRVREKTPWDLVLVGSGRYREQVETVSGNIPGIHFAGPQFGDNLCMHYSLANAVIVPSLRDPWGLVINEAMATGLPVLVSRGCGAAKTLVQEGENGWTFAPEDSNSLTELMLRTTLLTPAIRKAMGQKSKEIISLWSLDRYSEGVFEAVKLPARSPGGCLSDVLTKLWKGNVSIN